MSDMKRREFMSLLGGMATWPLAAGAQSVMPRSRNCNYACAMRSKSGKKGH
jgi:hypothetical protein